MEAPSVVLDFPVQLNIHALVTHRFASYRIASLTIDPSVTTARRVWVSRLSPVSQLGAPFGRLNLIHINMAQSHCPTPHALREAFFLSSLSLSPCVALLSLASVTWCGVCPSFFSPSVHFCWLHSNPLPFLSLPTFNLTFALLAAHYRHSLLLSSSALESRESHLH